MTTSKDLIKETILGFPLQPRSDILTSPYNNMHRLFAKQAKQEQTRQAWQLTYDSYSRTIYTFIYWYFNYTIFSFCV